MRLIPVIAIALIFFGCKKDQFTTKPQILYKSVNSTTISQNQTLEIRLTITDKEGDFSNLLGVKKTVAGCPTSDFIDSTKFRISDDFLKSKETKGEVVVTLDRFNRGSNTCLMPGGTRPDTAVYSFWTKDKAGNISDTAHSVKIIIID